MPFMIQTFRDYDDKLNAINARFEAAEKEKEDKKAEDSKGADQINATLNAHGPGHLLALMPRTSSLVLQQFVLMIND